jgi:phage tail sheath gpL-like
MDFDEIPYQWRQPATLLEIKPNYANKGLFDWPEQALIIGQKLASGSIEIGKIVEVTRWQDGIGLFGRGSVGAKMVEAYRKANKTSPLFVMALGDAAGAVKQRVPLPLRGR